MIKKKRFMWGIAVLLIGWSVFSAAEGVAADWPDAIISLPLNENAIIVEKETQSLFVYSNKNDKPALVLEMACSTGEVAGMKKRAGDKKTPEGVYFLIDEYEDRYLTPIYGKKAFPTDYPNLVDKRDGKNGSAIWIHGTNKPLKPMDSNGCVALENHNILKLESFITLDSTPVIMVETIEKHSTETQQRKENINQLISGWLSALGRGTYHDYLSFYSPDYLPDIQWWREWQQIRKESLKFDPQFKISAENRGIYKNHGVAVALFDLNLVVKGQQITLGKRKLFMEPVNTNYKIVGDRFQRIAKTFENTTNPLIAATQSVVKPEMKKSEVLETVQQWIAAWTAKDMDRYASFYAKNFYSDRLTKSQWVRRKKSLARKYNYIHVSGSDFKIKTNGKKSEVVFFQEYESSGFSTQGTKTLKLVDEGGLWKIYQESWKEK